MGKYDITCQDYEAYNRVKRAFAHNDLELSLDGEKYQGLSLSEGEKEALIDEYVDDIIDGLTSDEAPTLLRALIDKKHPQKHYVVEVHTRQFVLISCDRYSEADAHEYAKNEVEATTNGLIEVESCTTVRIDDKEIEPISDERTTFYEDEASKAASADKYKVSLKERLLYEDIQWRFAAQDVLKRLSETRNEKEVTEEQLDEIVTSLLDGESSDWAYVERNETIDRLIEDYI